MARIMAIIIATLVAVMMIASSLSSSVNAQPPPVPGPYAWSGCWQLDNEYREAFQLNLNITAKSWPATGRPILFTGIWTAWKDHQPYASGNITNGFLTPNGSISALVYFPGASPQAQYSMMSWQAPLPGDHAIHVLNPVECYTMGDFTCLKQTQSAFKDGSHQCERPPPPSSVSSSSPPLSSVV